MTGLVWPPSEVPGTLDQLPTPSLVIDTDRLARNVSAMASGLEAANVKLRPHVKTSKSWFVAEQQLKAGAIGFTCSTPAEVAWLAGMGVTDLLWAHVPTGPAKIDFVVQAAGEGVLTVALDSVEAARPLGEAAATEGVELPYVLEVNTGQARNGVDPDLVVDRVQTIAGLAGLRFRGILTHEGQIGGMAGDRTDREAAGTGVGALMVRLAEDLTLAGFAPEIVSVGSTPGASSAPYVPGITEARPGTYVYYDMNQVRVESCTLDECAMTVLARVVSVQRSGRAIIDAGVKAMSSDSLGAAGSLGLVCDLDLKPLPDITFADGNEEHGFLIGDGASSLAVGDLVRIVPNHACGTTNMWSCLIAVTGQTVTGVHPITARY